MIMIECPCCEHEIRMELDAAELACDECAVTAPIAPGELRIPLRAAA